MSKKAKVCKKFDVVVIGGGVAGVCAAIRSARSGASTVLINDRPVLGGNSSTEVGVLIQGADELGHFRYSRETGLIDEFFSRNVHFPNPQLSPSIWSLILWEACRGEENLEVLLNTVASEPVLEGSLIKQITARQGSTETDFTIEGEIFIDSSGDGRVAFEAGADCTTGRESKKQYKESLAPAREDNLTMGNTVYIRARDMGKPVKFTPPDWAYTFETDDDFPGQLMDCPHNLAALFRPAGGYWWFEFGGENDIIGDAEFIRDELYRIVLGVWDHIKNRGDHGAENFVLESVGTVPGRRESRRFLGDYVLTQQDIQSLKVFPDAVAYGGWHVDLHNPAGVLGKGQRYWNGRVLQGRYTIPFRSLYSRNISNLLLAGRLISASHIAMGSTRVMGTCALMGEAVGCAAAMCVDKKYWPRALGKNHIEELQQKLVRLDCFIPGIADCDEENLARSAQISASSIADVPPLTPEKYVPLDKSRAQNVLVSPGDFSNIILPLENSSGEPQEVAMRIVKREFMDDLREGESIQAAKAIVPPGRDNTLFEFTPIVLEENTILGICLEPNEKVSWGFSEEEFIGTQAGVKIDQVFTKPGSELYFHRIRGTHCFDLQRPNEIYTASQVSTGVSRPEKSSNMWISQATLPQEICLNWNETKTFNSIELTFDNDLDITREKWAEQMCAPRLIRNYIIDTEINGEKHVLVSEQDNIYRKRYHNLEQPLSTDNLRICIEATWGALEARVFEIKVFNHEKAEP